MIDDDGDVDLALVQSGMCWWYRKYAHEQSKVDQVLYEGVEETARREGRRLWRDSASEEASI